MTRLFRTTALAPLLTATGTLLLLALGLAALRRSESAQDTPSATSTTSAVANQPAQSVKSPSYPAELLEPRRLQTPADVVPAAFQFDPPPLAGGKDHSMPAAATTQTVEPAPSTPWGGAVETPFSVAGLPAIAPPTNAAPRRLPPAGENSGEARTDSADGLPKLEPRRLPPVDDQVMELPAADLSSTRLPPGPASEHPSGEDDGFELKPSFQPDELGPSPALPQSGPRFPPSETREAPTDEIRYPADSAPQLHRLPAMPSQAFQPATPAAPAEQKTWTAPSHTPTPQRDVPPLRRPTAFDPELAAVSRQAMEMVQYGFSLAHRGASFSARAQFIQSLRSIAQALDAVEGNDLHAEALAEGLRALEEADDFVPRGSRLEADMDLNSIIASHRTMVLKGEPTPTALEALQRYYTYAQQRLASAGGGMPAASMALYALGKLHTAAPDQTPQQRRLNDPKALALHHAALLVDSRNYESANELGVLLARYGQLQDARGVLLHGLSMHATASLWHNLSVVHERLGEVDLARRARHEQELAERQSPDNPLASAVRWVPPEEFARTSQSADPSLTVPSDTR